jgi:hypothetical protein
MNTQATPSNTRTPAAPAGAPPAAAVSIPPDPAAAKAARAAAKERRRQEALQELEAIEDVQARIDRVAADLKKRRPRYKKLTAEELMELLEVDDPGGSDDWTVFYLRRINQLENSDCAYPLAENVELLEGKVGARRFEELSQRALDILLRNKGPDLVLSRREEAALRRAYPKHRVDDCGVGLAITTLRASNGDTFSFEALIGDAGDAEEFWSPYERGFDTTNYEEIE